MDITEKDARLRYFYLIDTNSLAQKVSDKLEPTADPKTLFDLIFRQMEQSCERYLNFVWSPNSFNNSGKPDIYSNPILRIVLKHHCILHGFLSAVEKDSQNRDCIKISGAKDTMLHCGYFYTNFYREKPTYMPDNYNVEAIDSLPQVYNQYKNRFNKYSDSYSYKILINHCQDFCNNFPNVSRYEGSWACFIYTMPEVLTLNRTIGNFQNPQSKTPGKYNKSLIKYYNNLFSCYKKWYYQNNLTLEDKILFESAMEPIYGFRFFFYASKLIHKIHTAPIHDTDLTYKDLEGTAMLKLILQAAQLPIIYNRSVFLEHAIRSVLSSQFLKSQNYQESSCILFTRLSKKAVPKELLSLSGMEHIRIYLQKLTYVALPLLEDIWDVIIYKLNHNSSSKDKFCINIDTYRSYLTENYMAIASDYSWYFEKDSEEQMSEFSQDSFYEKLTSANIETIYQEFCFPSVKYSAFETDSFQDLLLGYFKKERFINPKPELYQQYMSFMAEGEASVNKGIYNDELKFFKHHAEAILAYAESLMPLKKQ